MTNIKGTIVRGPGVIPYDLSVFGFEVSPRSQSTFGANWELFFVTKVVRNINNLVWFVIFGMIYTVAWYKFKEREI